MGDDDLGVLERAWAVLTPPRGNRMSSYPLDVSFGGIPCRVALDASANRHLLIPVEGETLPSDQRPSVLGLAVRKLAFGGQVSTYVDLSCEERDLFAEFDEVAEDVLDAAVEADNPGGAAIRAVGRWRRLFRSRLVRGLSYQARLALFAELSVLSAMIDERPDLPVDLWRGPLLEPHDFEAPARCVEVKALGPEADAVTVHGLAQLDVHDDRPLDLLLVTVVEDPDGTTISDLVERLRGRVVSRTDLRSRLTAAGWQSDQASHDDESFAVAEVMRVTVEGDVPRLATSALVGGAPPAGVSDVRYSLDIAALLPFTSAASLPRIARAACA